MSRLLLTPFEHGRLSLRSRVVVPPMLDRLGSQDGFVTEQLCQFYAARTEGGVGLAIVGGMAVSELAKYRPGGLHIYDDTYIPGLKRLAESLHRTGAKIGAQLQHAGRMVADPPQQGNRTLGPSSLTDTLTGRTVQGLTIREIGDVVRSFAAATARARAAGFDHVEVHASHGYLPSAFLSPFTNRREDAYGGDAAGRARIVCEIVEAVREAAGDGMTVGVRLNGTDFVEGGTTLEDTIKQARLIARHGVDVFHVSAGTPDVFDLEFPSGFNEPGCYRAFARAVRDATGLPTIAVGRINSPAVAEDIIASGDADLVAVGRALIADPAFVRKAADNKDDNIRPCIACNACIDKEPGPFPPTPCSVNFLAGREGFIEIPEAASRLRVLVVGAGPGGLEAARALAEHGHELLVVERSDRVGGQMAIAATLPHKKDFGRWIRYAHQAAIRAGATFRLETPLTHDILREFRPDAAIMATGAAPGRLGIPGSDQPHVVQAVDVLRDGLHLGSRVVVIGGTRIGLVTAEHLAAEGHHVTIIEESSDIAAEMGYTFKKGVVRRLAAHGVVVETRTRVTRVGAGWIQILKDHYLAGGRSELVERPIDNVVLALERIPLNDASAMLDATGVPWRAVGDCVEPRRIINAVHEAARAAILL